jgi:diguanylate cyclase (GGDEF)-like protein
LDLDNFKHINDAYGHTMGDKVLQIVGNVLKQSARQGDIVCRSGGEEFEILLANANVEEASEVARRILTNLAHNTPDGIPTITASIGVTDIRQSDYNDSLRQRADEAMYQAKKQGKARINVFSNT